MKKIKWNFDIVFIVILFFFLIIFPFIVRNPYLIDTVITVLLFAFLGNAWNIVGGLAGQASLGQSAYYGIGAYTSTILLIKFGLSPWIGMFTGAIIASCLAIIFGYPSLRMKGPYFVFFTIGFAETMRILFLTWDWVQGSRGIIIPYKTGFSNMMFAKKEPYYYIILIFLVLGLCITYFIQNSKIGRYCIAIREDDIMAQAIGINTALYKTYTFAISAAIMAIGGTFYAQYVLFIHPNDIMSLNNSLIFMLVAVAGGMGHLFGPLIGALLIMPFWEYFRATFGGRYVGLGIAFAGLAILVIGTAAPNGILGIWDTIKKKIGKINAKRR
jgi:branched-chain amino acid transport system permease protein